MQKARSDVGRPSSKICQESFPVFPPRCRTWSFCNWRTCSNSLKPFRKHVRNNHLIMKKNKAKKNNPTPRADQPHSPLNSEEVQSYSYDCTELDGCLRHGAKKEARPAVITLTDNRSRQIVRISVTNRPPARKDLKSVVERAFSRLSTQQGPPLVSIPDNQGFKKGQG